MRPNPSTARAHHPAGPASTMGLRRPMAGETHNQHACSNLNPDQGRNPGHWRQQTASAPRKAAPPRQRPHPAFAQSTERGKCAKRPRKCISGIIPASRDAAMQYRTGTRAPARSSKMPANQRGKQHETLRAGPRATWNAAWRTAPHRPPGWTTATKRKSKTPLRQLQGRAVGKSRQHHAGFAHVHEVAHVVDEDGRHQQHL